MDKLPGNFVKHTRNEFQSQGRSSIEQLHTKENECIERGVRTMYQSPVQRLSYAVRHTERLATLS